MIVCRVIIDQENAGTVIDTTVTAADLAGVRAWCAAAEVVGPARIYILQYTIVVQSYILCYTA